ncbi:MAG: S8 family serine peptidase [Planctomycetaceae bacterium]|jgi:subtilisin family serine protease|nr:S8 family serine peptidase [Planctomycetaceae bacterium]
MKKSLSQSRLNRNCRFEIMEDRIAMSAAPLTGADTLNPYEEDTGVPSCVSEPDQSPDTYALINPSGNNQQKYNDMTGLENAKDLYGLDGSGQTIVIIDSGVAYDHAALGGGFGEGYKVVGGYDFAENDANPYDDSPGGGHGTHVAGIIGSESTLYPGVAPGVDIVILRIFDDNGNGNFEWLNQALQWVHANQYAFENPITTINLSVGFQEDAGGYMNTLNESLRILHDDGIFISVAAGNSFQTLPDQLNCLAASEYVVAVGACDTTGALSYFSQRDGSIIVAPGQNIKNTVSDAKGNKNGIADDYATLSGTSMASPYVAASSVLIRQAFTLVGKTGITQDDIYRVMFDTADSIFDSATGKTYKRLNLQKAIESILPKDTAGETAATAANVSTKENTFTVDGFFNNKTDKDYYVFTAGESGKVTIQAETAGTLTGKWDISGIPGAVIDADGNVVFTATAGQKYTIGFNAAGSIGAYTLKVQIGDAKPVTPPAEPPLIDTDTPPVTTPATPAVPPATPPAVTPPIDPPVVEPPVDTNPVTPPKEDTPAPPDTSVTPPVQESPGTPMEVKADQTVIGHQKIAQNGTWYSLSAVHSGIMTVEVALPNGTTLSHVVIEQVDAEGNVIATSQNTTRIDLNVTAGSTVLIRIRSLGGEILDADVRVCNLVRREGKNVFLVGTNGDDTITFTAGSTHTVEINGTKYIFQANETGRINIDTKSGNDRVLLVGSNDSERIDINGTDVGMSTGTYQVHVTGAEYFSIDTRDAQDSLWFYGTSKNDNLVVRTDGITINSDRFFAEVKNIRNFYAYSGGGNDTVTLYDSPGNDVLTVNASYAVFNSSGVNSQFYDFASLIARSTHGGYDTVTFTDTRGDDLFIGNSQNMKRFSGSQYAEAEGFTQINLISLFHSGRDTVQLEDSAGDDTLVISQHDFVMSGSHYSISVRGFDQVHADSVFGGNDKVMIYDILEKGRVIAKNRSINVTDTVYEYGADGFDEVWLFGRSNGENRIEQGKIDYVLYALGEWTQNDV